MYLKTKYFGELPYDDEDILHFENGVFGFSGEKRFLLLPFAGSEGALLCLQSVQTLELAFVVMDPFALKPDYAPILRPEELGALGVELSQELCFYVMCVVREPVAESTLNLKCPVVVNGDTRQAAQVILDSGDYQMRHRLSEFGPKEGGAC